MPLVPDDGYGDLLEKAYRQCAETLHAALRDVIDGKAPPPQETLHPVGFYCGQRKPGDEWLDWRNTSADIHNFVRGIGLPGPCARTRLDGREIAIVRTWTGGGGAPYRATPGEVVGRDGNGNPGEKPATR
jgi:methionyl-tRNA formyltransferase